MGRSCRDNLYFIHSSLSARCITFKIAKILHFQPKNKDYLTTPEAAKILGLSEKTLRNYEKRRIIPKVERCGKKKIRRFYKRDIELIKEKMNNWKKCNHNHLF